MIQDRRTTYRCASPAHQEPAILRLGRKDYPARVVEESAEGMGVFLEGRELPVKPGDKVQLTTASRRVAAQVVHVKTAAAHDGPDASRGQRLGLEKLGDLGFATRTGDARLPHQSAGLGTGAMRFAMALAVCLGMFLGGVMFDWSKLKGGASFHSSGTNTAPAASAPRVSQASKRFASRKQQFADSLLRFDDFASSEFTQLLQLNPQQQDRIGRIVDETISVMSLLHANRSAQSDEAWAEMGMQTLHASWKQIQSELTPEQRARWAQAMASS